MSHSVKSRPTEPVCVYVYRASAGHNKQIVPVSVPVARRGYDYLNDSAGGDHLFPKLNEKAGGKSEAINQNQSKQSEHVYLGMGEW